VLLIKFRGINQPPRLAAKRYAPLLHDRFDLTFVEVFLIFFSPTLPVVFITDFLIMQVAFSKGSVKSNLSSVNFEIPKFGFSEHKADKLP